MNLSAVLQNWGGTGSAIGLLGATVWMVFTGRLVPRKVHDQALSAERQRGDDWRAAYQAEASRNEVRDAQMNEVLAFVRRSPRETA